jgi:serine/threonine protein kinase
MFEDPTEVDPQIAEMVGEVLAGRYRIDGILGIGSMGAVLDAYHEGLKQKVAIKVLHPQVTNDEQISKRFDREAMSASRLDHPNCVRVMDFGTSKAGIRYLVMQFLEGRELGDLLDDEGTMPPERAIELTEQILAGLEHAHERGVAHRDLKPANIFVTHDAKAHEVLKIVDFGLSKITDEASADNLSRAGLVFGTPHYMSPEQALGQPSDHRADIYATGILLYRMLAGARPYDADDPVELIRKHAREPLPPLPDHVPAGLAAILAEMTAKKPDDRYPTAAAVLADLLALREPSAADPAQVPVRSGATVFMEAPDLGAEPGAAADDAGRRMGQAILVGIGVVLLVTLTWILAS